MSEAIGDGDIRDDIDPLLAADLLKAVEYGLAVETSLDSESISAERAFDVAILALSLLKRDQPAQQDSQE